ncbi:MAG: DUF4382 domain-containing protein [Bacteroidota bacterium]
MKTLIQNFLIFTILAGGLASCTDEKQDSDNKGEVNVKLTDATFPFSFVSEANMEIRKIEFRNSEGEYVTVFESEGNTGNRYNLLDYTNGNTATVNRSSLPVGTYTHSRVTFNEASVVMNGSITGSGENSIFNYNNNALGTYEVVCDPYLEVEDSGVSDVLIDIDVNSTFRFQSSFFGLNWFHQITNISGCACEPTFRVCDLNRTGKISGNVTYNGVNADNAFITVTLDENQIATHSEANGTYAFIGIKPGSYVVKVELEDGTVSEKTVTVNGTDNSNCDFVLN